MQTKIVKTSEISECVKVLHNSGIIVYPTETSYGIGADAFNEKAVKKVFAAKQRSAEKQLSVIVADEEMAERYCEISENDKKLFSLMRKKPLTLIAKRKDAKGVDSSLAFRIPLNDFALCLVKAFGSPITATSANISGSPVIHKIDEIKKTFSGKVDLIVDAGDLHERKPSTIYCLIRRKIIREGDITDEEINHLLK